MAKNEENRFGIDLTEVTTERVLVPANEYSAKVDKVTLVTGIKDETSWYRFDILYAVKDEAVAKLLSQDTPKVFSNFFIALDRENGKIAINNPDFGAFLAATGLKEKEAQDLFNEAGMAGKPETQQDFNKAYLTKVAEVAQGIGVLVKVVHKASNQDKSVMNAVVTKVAKG